jgi:hypothetical protein
MLSTLLQLSRGKASPAYTTAQWLWYRRVHGRMETPRHRPVKGRP